MTDPQEELVALRKELADLKNRYLTPWYPRVLDDALVMALEGCSGHVQAAELLEPARQALVNRRRMAELLAKSAAGQPWLKCPACGDDWALAGPPVTLADSEADELRKALADERETRAALEAQLVTLRGAVEIGAENERRLQGENERLALDVDGLHLEAQFQRENADRASRSFLTAQGERDVAREETRAARQAALDLGRDLTRQMELLAEGKQLEQARAETAETHVETLLRTMRAPVEGWSPPVFTCRDPDAGGFWSNSELDGVEISANAPTSGEAHFRCVVLMLRALVEERQRTAPPDVAAAVLREREEIATHVADLRRGVALSCVPTGAAGLGYLNACDEMLRAIRSRGGQ